MKPSYEELVSSLAQVTLEARLALQGVREPNINVVRDAEYLLATIYRSEQNPKVCEKCRGDGYVVKHTGYCVHPVNREGGCGCTRIEVPCDCQDTGKEVK